MSGQEFRVGQVVRATVPGTSFAVEGKVIRRDAHTDVLLLEYGVTRSSLWPPRERRDLAEWTFTVLSEPRPEEPTGLGAAVEEAFEGGATTRWVHVGGGVWREESEDDDALHCRWKHIGARIGTSLRVLSEGWKP